MPNWISFIPTERARNRREKGRERNKNSSRILVSVTRNSFPGIPKISFGNFGTSIFVTYFGNFLDHNWRRSWSNRRVLPFLYRLASAVLFCPCIWFLLHWQRRTSERGEKRSTLGAAKTTFFFLRVPNSDLFYIFIIFRSPIFLFSLWGTDGEHLWAPYRIRYA